jgi:hypothetical protein
MFMATLYELRTNPALKLLLRRILRVMQEMDMHQALGDPHGTSRDLLHPSYVQLITDTEHFIERMGSSKAEAEQWVGTLILDAITARRGHRQLDSMTLEQALGEEPL